MAECDLSQGVCEPCSGGVPPLGDDEIMRAMAQLHPNWEYLPKDGAMERNLAFKGFARSVYYANLAAFLGDKEGHHPDVTFGWGYCRVRFTSHEAGGITQNDLICAAKFDRLVEAQ